MKNGHIPSEELSRYLDGYAFEDPSFEEHLKSCGLCTAELKNLEFTVHFIGTINHILIPDPRFTAAVLAKCKHKNRMKKYLLPASAAAVIILIASASLYNYFSTVTPVDFGKVAADTDTERPVRYKIDTSSFNDVNSLKNYLKTGARVVETGKNYVTVDVTKGNLAPMMRAVNATGEDVYFIEQRGLALTGGDGMPANTFDSNVLVRVKVTIDKYK